MSRIQSSAALPDQTGRQAGRDHDAAIDGQISNFFPQLKQKENREESGCFGPDEVSVDPTAGLPLQLRLRPHGGRLFFLPAHASEGLTEMNK